MINLNLAIYDGDIQILKFHNTIELCDYLLDLRQFKCIWLATEDGGNGEIFITEDINILIKAIKSGVFNLVWNDPQNFFLQEYQTYEDAYAVALDMRETNPNCYN